jgi:outer membrane receptor protein involved in Fe transport
LARQVDFSIANVRLSTRLSDSRFEFALWCRNIMDKKYIARALVTGNGLIKALPADPRTFGVTATYRFGAR